MLYLFYWKIICFILLENNLFSKESQNVFGRGKVYLLVMSHLATLLDVVLVIPIEAYIICL